MNSPLTLTTDQKMERVLSKIQMSMGGSLRFGERAEVNPQFQSIYTGYSNQSSSEVA